MTVQTRWGLTRVHATVGSLRTLAVVSVKVRDCTDTVGSYACTCHNGLFNNAGSNKCEVCDCTNTVGVLHVCMLRLIP